jgi:LysR family transcriptional regulator, regulator of abg operon
LKLNHLRDVLAIAERGSVRAAARSLGVPQPALSRSIRELERELGVPLFERTARGVTLTQGGALFLGRAKAVRSELRRARDELDQFRGITHGRVVACLSTVPHISMLAPALRPFRERYPDVHLEIFDGLYPSIEPALRDGTLDFYIGPPPERVPAEFVADTLFENTRVILCRKGHPLAGARSLSELTEAEWITTSVTYKAEEEIGPLFAQFNLPAPRLVMQAHSALTFLVAVAYYDLLTMLPVQWLDFPMTRDALQRIHVKEPLPGRPICILRRAGLPLTPAAEYFCDMIRRAAAPPQSSSSPPRSRRRSPTTSISRS